ncbi:casein kinase 2 regulatory subunit [Coemansia sp. RSA 2599]|nr:casein kinase 2 regulatory subunit [Coemansia sp. RSA 2598]KAJ1826649.1 casein kinase 2 regulatory subunit [Coemansia sp. RSA 2599]
MAEPANNTNLDPELSTHGRPSAAEGEYHSELDNTESDYDEEPYASDESASLTWISWFCSLKGHEYFCEVPEAFIEDEFNLTGLSQTVNYYVEALDMILDIEDENDDPQYTDEIEAIDSSAEILYGLIHARYILTRSGMDQMADKYENGEFGSCPRYCCDGAFVVPCGRTDVPERDSVKLFCPSCNDIYSPPSSRYQKIDGAYFGTTFPHMFFQTFPTLVPDEPAAIYVPRIYGFAINERSKAGPRMQWLRMLPDKSAADATAADGDGDGDGEDLGNSTGSQSYVEARDHAAEPPEALTEGMDVGTDRPAASRASTPAAASTPLPDKNDTQNDENMPTASNSPRNARAGSPIDGRQKDYSSSASVSAVAA